MPFPAESFCRRRLLGRGEISLPKSGWNRRNRRESACPMWLRINRAAEPTTRTPPTRLGGSRSIQLSYRGWTAHRRGQAQAHASIETSNTEGRIVAATGSQLRGRLQRRCGHGSADWLRVEALAGKLLSSAAPKLDLHEDLVSIALQRVQGDQGEAAVGDELLVDRLELQLCRCGHRALHEGATPDERHRAGAAVLAAPAADHLVVEVNAPVGVVLREHVGEVGCCLEVRWVATLGLYIGDLAEELELAVWAGDPGGARNPDPTAPRALWEPLQLLWRLCSLGQAGDPATCVAKALTQALGEAAVRDPLLRAVGDEAWNRPRVWRHRPPAYPAEC